MNGHAVAGPAAAPPGVFTQLNLAVGNLFFRIRNAAFPVLFVLVGVAARPHPYVNDPALDGLLRATGALIALAGEAVRLSTIGFEYIDRGGKGGKVYATRLVHTGVYGLTRNPMYLGNILIASGMSVYSGAPLVCWVAIPLFLFIYQAITVAEEHFLRSKFGEDYAAYCREVPRFWPKLSRVPGAFAGLSYNWRKAVRKDIGTAVGVVLGLIALPIVRRFWLNGGLSAREELPSFALLGLVLAAYAGLAWLKKRRKFFYDKAE